MEADLEIIALTEQYFVCERSTASISFAASTFPMTTKRRFISLNTMGCPSSETVASADTSNFGVLTRIDLHAKIKEKIGKEIPPTIILGACNPSLAFEAFVANPDVASLLPCNAVIRDVGDGRMSIELVRPSAIMEMLGDKKLVELAAEADQKLEQALENFAVSPK